MVIGFGETEEAVAKQIIKECQEAIKETGNIASVEKIKKQYYDLGEKYKSMNKSAVPERYTYFWVNGYKPYDGKYILEFTMSHINRQHALSLDGWACLQTNWVLIISEINGDRIFQEK